MSHFIKLTTVVINKSHIIGITIKPKIYEILITNYNMDGILLFGTGFIDIKNNIIKICHTIKQKRKKGNRKIEAEDNEADILVEISAVVL